MNKKTDRVSNVITSISEMSAPSDLVARVETNALGLQHNTRKRNSTSKKRSSKTRSTLQPKSKDATHSRWVTGLTAVSLAGTVAAMLIAAIIFLTQPTPVMANWEQVTRALQGKAWIHGSLLNNDGVVREMWYSPEDQIWALRLGGYFVFSNAADGTSHEYNTSSAVVEKLPIRDSIERPLLENGMLADSSRAMLDLFFHKDEISSIETETVSENGKQWTLIGLQMRDWGGREGTAELRVDPDTSLPVSLTQFHGDKKFVWTFDYPETGPADIFALGVKSTIAVVDRIPPAPEQAVLDKIAASRKRLGDFQMMVTTEDGPIQHVLRRGTSWNVDSFYIDRFADKTAEVDVPWHEVATELIETGTEAQPLYRCNGKTVLKNSSMPGVEPKWAIDPFTTPARLLDPAPDTALSSTDGVKLMSWLYPDLRPKFGWGFEVVFKPTDHPNLILIKRSAEMATAKPTTGHEWYYVDPAKGHAVVLMRAFSLPSGAQPDPKIDVSQIRTLSDFKQNQHGFWYPTKIVNESQVLGPDDDFKDPDLQHYVETYRYHLVFNSDDK